MVRQIHAERAGAMLLVGTGHLPYDQLADRVAEATRLLVKGAHA